MATHEEVAGNAAASFAAAVELLEESKRMATAAENQRNKALRTMEEAGASLAKLLGRHKPTRLFPLNGGSGGSVLVQLRNWGDDEATRAVGITLFDSRGQFANGEHRMTGNKLDERTRLDGAGRGQQAGDDDH